MAFASFGRKFASAGCPSARMRAARRSSDAGISSLAGRTTRRARSHSTPQRFPECAPLNDDGVQGGAIASSSATSASSSSGETKSGTRKWPGSAGSTRKRSAEAADAVASSRESEDDDGSEEDA